MNDTATKNLPVDLEAIETAHGPDLRKKLSNTLVTIKIDEVSDSISDMLKMEIFSVDVSRFKEEHAARLEEIKTMSPSAAFTAIDELVNAYFKEKLLDFVKTSQVKGAPFSTNVINKMEEKEPFTGLDEHDREYNIWLQIYSSMIDLRQQLVFEYIEALDPENPVMHEVGKIEYMHFLGVTEAMKYFFIEWNKDAARTMDSETRQKNGFTDELATIRENENGEYEEVKWNMAFQPEISGIVGTYKALAKKLEELLRHASPANHPMIKAKVAYYTAVADAYESCEKEDFIKADILLPQQNQGRLDVPVHIHSIEYGYWKDRIQRMPEACLRFPDEKGKKVNELAQRTKSDMIRELKKFLAEGSYPQETWNTINQVEGTNYTANHFMGSGFEIVFAPSGQILPNEIESRIKGGINITCDLDSTKKRLGRRYSATKAVFGKETANEIANPDNYDLDKALGLGVASHEYGHAIGLTSDTLERIDRTLLGTHAEEWKATVGGMVLAEKRASESEESEVTFEDLQASLKAKVVDAARYASMRKTSFATAYLRHSIMICKVLEENGILIEDNDNWHIDVGDPKNIESVYAKLEQQYRDLIRIYGDGTTDDLRKFLQENLQPTKFMQFVFAQLDKSDEYDLDGAPTLEEICVTKNA